MITEEQFAEFLTQCQLDKHWEEFYEWYVKACQFDALIGYGVANWDGYGDAMRSLETEED